MDSTGEKEFPENEIIRKAPECYIEPILMCGCKTLTILFQKATKENGANRSVSSGGAATNLMDGKAIQVKQY